MPDRTADVSVIVPYRGDGGARDEAWAYVRQWWGRERPGWQIVQGSCQPGPWCKAAAVADALPRCDGDLFIVADADVIGLGVGEAVEAVRAGAAWAVPHRAVYRLTAEASQAVYAGGGLPARPPDLPVRRRQPNQRPRTHRYLSGAVAEEHTGVAGGGLVVLPRDTYQRVPLDPRFLGFGQEDTSWSLALVALVGRPWRSAEPLWHMWHEPQERMTRAVGSRESYALYQRYKGARNPAEMRALLAEFQVNAA